MLTAAAGHAPAAWLFIFAVLVAAGLIFTSVFFVRPASILPSLRKLTVVTFSLAGWLRVLVVCVTRYRAPHHTCPLRPLPSTSNRSCRTLTSVRLLSCPVYLLLTGVYRNGELIIRTHSRNNINLTYMLRAGLHQPDRPLQPSQLVHLARARAARFPHRPVPARSPVDLYHLQRAAPRLQCQQVRVLLWQLVDVVLTAHSRFRSSLSTCRTCLIADL